MGKEKKTYSSAEEEMEARQKKLIPLNIVVAVMALVAAISILFLPLLRLNVEDAAELMAAGDAGGSQESGDEGQTSAEEMLSGFSFAVSLNGVDFVNIGFSGSLTGSLIDILSEAFSERADELVARALAAELSDSGIDEEVVSEIGGAIRGLEAAQTGEAIGGVASALAQTLADSLGESASADTAELESGIREMYDDTVSHTGGVFTTEALICVTASGSLNEGDGTGEVYTSFTELLNASFASEGGSFGEIDETIPKGALVGIGAAIAFFAFVWFVLFLFALVRIFLKNKRFTMWYVKLFGFFPCLLFGVAPLVAGSVVPEAAAVTGMLSSLSWISGACYVLLWLISVFWAFPIKRKIRRLKKEIG